MTVAIYCTHLLLITLCDSIGSGFVCTVTVTFITLLEQALAASTHVCHHKSSCSLTVFHLPIVYFE